MSSIPERNNPRKLWPIAIPLFSAFFLNCEALAHEMFNPQFLHSSGDNADKTDLSVFANSQSQAPGDYVVDVWLNNRFIETRTINFRLDGGGSKMLPCLTLPLLTSWNVRTGAFPDLQEDSQGCVNISAIPQATTSFIFNTQRLMISIPQAALHASARGYISPDRYDEGITAFLLNYRFSGANSSTTSRRLVSQDSQYLSLQPGLNVGAWRLRNYTTWNRSSSAAEQGRWASIYTLLQRNIIPLKAQLTLGESHSQADIFESVPFLGGQLVSDDEMQPESLRGYAPVVRGIAKTNAQVIIRQNGYIIYQSYVAPGAFAITDLYATGGSGDLYVTIKETDGSEQNLTVPFASLPVLVREGYFKYSVTTGRYRHYNSAVDKKHFAQATAIYGLPWNMTLFGGMQAAANYRSFALGMGKNFGRAGAISADIIHAQSSLADKSKASGQSLRVRYSKNFYQTGTNFAIAGYRYSTRDYYSLPELMASWRADYRRYPREQARNRTELTLNQNLGDRAGSLSLSLLREDYWRTERRTESFSTSYNNSYNGITCSFAWGFNRNSLNRASPRRYEKNQTFSFTVSVPLDRWLSGSWANYMIASGKPGNTSHSLGISGVALEDSNLNWSVREGYTSQGAGNSGNLDAVYRGTYGELAGGYGYNKQTRRINYGIEGGVLLHKNGLTLSQPFRNTAALVIAPDVTGVRVNNQTGVKTDFRGYTLVPDLPPYRLSDVVLDSTTLPDNVDLDLTSQSVVPTRGAIVAAHFSAQTGARVIMTLTYHHQPVPFGATVVDLAASKQASIVGDEGQVYLNGLKSSGTLLVQWGKAADKQCRVSYVLPEEKNKTGIHMLNGLCQ